MSVAREKLSKKRSFATLTHLQCAYQNPIPVEVRKMNQCCGAGAGGAEIILGPGAGNKF